MRKVFYAIKRFIRRHPSLYFTIVGRREAVRRLRARRDSELVVEAFPRSANTTSMYALFFAQGECLKVGHHLHVAAHVVFAAKYHIPCLVIMREPVECITSLMVMRKGGEPAELLKDYIDFAKVVMRHQSQVVVVDFNVIKSEGIGSGVRKLNARFKTQFMEPTNSAEEREWVEFKIREWNLEHSGGDLEKLSIPTDAKKSKADEMKALVVAEHQLLERARRFYLNLVT